ncbi:hypothetical protein OTU49_000579, partial [Cherax quadricarinatus]
MDIPVTQLPPGDPRLVEAIVGQLKSKGIFDQFRKECLADVDTKPAFQNLRQRVEGHVNKFLEKSTWKNDMNKNQLRDGVRKHVNNLGILDTGIDAIITQVVNPKIKPLILPYVEDTVYTFLQIDKPKRERQGSNRDEQEETVQLHIQSLDTKPSLLPMETDVISSEEDDILARESPESTHRSTPSPNGDLLKIEDEDAQDGFESYPPYDDSENAQDSVVAHVERLCLTEEVEDKPVPPTRPPLALFDDQSLDSISSNSSGLTFSTLSGKGSPGSRKLSDNMEKSQESPKMLQDVRSTTSTPLVDEKPIDEDTSQSPMDSETAEEFQTSETKFMESQPQSLAASTTTQTPSQSSGGVDKDDQNVASGARMTSPDDDSQESRGSVSKVSIASERSEVEEKAKSEKSEGEISSSSSESSDNDKGRPEESVRSEEKHYTDTPHKSSRSKSDHKSKRDSHSRERDREREKEKEAKHSKDKERKHSKSRDDHHSHRDKDKKHHRRDKDHDGDRDRSRSHHYQSSSSSNKESSGSGKSSGEKDKDRSSHQSNDKSAEGKSRRDCVTEKAENKPSNQLENKSLVSENEIIENKPTDALDNKVDDSTGEKEESKSDIKLDSQAEKHEEKSGSKLENKNDKTENKSNSKSENKNEKSESKSNSKSESKSSSKLDKSVSKSNGSKNEKSERSSNKSESKTSSKADGLSEKSESKSNSKLDSKSGSKSDGK